MWDINSNHDPPENQIVENNVLIKPTILWLHLRHTAIKQWQRKGPRFLNTDTTETGHFWDIQSRQFTFRKTEKIAVSHLPFLSVFIFKMQRGKKIPCM